MQFRISVSVGGSVLAGAGAVSVVMVVMRIAVRSSGFIFMERLRASDVDRRIEW